MTRSSPREESLHEPYRAIVVLVLVLARSHEAILLVLVRVPRPEPCPSAALGPMAPPRRSSWPCGPPPSSDRQTQERDAGAWHGMTWHGMAPIRLARFVDPAIVALAAAIHMYYIHHGICTIICIHTRASIHTRTHTCCPALHCTDRIPSSPRAHPIGLCAPMPPASYSLPTTPYQHLEGSSRASLA